MELRHYVRLTQQVTALIAGESDLIANLANISALLKMELTDVNWLGFYLFKDDQLVLGPFQGKPACIRIPLSKGVCGKAFSSNTVQRIDDVHQFAGHIACDAASNSELVIPFHKDGQLIGVLDIDSPKFARFSESDAKGLSDLMKEVEKIL